jgi:TolA-binding protein
LGTLRWVGGGAVSALAVWAGVEAGVHVAGAGNAVEANPRSASVSEPVAPNISVNELEPTLEPEPSATALAPPPEAPTKLRVARSTTPVRSAPADTSQGPSADSLSAELLALDQARAALVNGDAALALRSVDAYVRRFPKRRLDAEATVLRIESLVALGDHASATRIGRGFLARHSRGPYARRVNSLIGEPSVSGTSKR